MKDRLIELCENLILSCKSSLCDDCEHNNIDYPHCMSVHFADYLIANGVVVPPCKIGETVYDAREFFYKADAPDLYEMKSDDICVEKDSKSGEYRFIYDDAYVSYDDIGKTVFLTREEAEKALQEVKGK